MSRQETAAYLGLVGLVIGVIMFHVFGYPVVRADLRRRFK